MTMLMIMMLRGSLAACLTIRSRERKIRFRLFAFDAREMSNIFLVSTEKLLATVSTAYRKHNCVFTGISITP